MISFAQDIINNNGEGAVLRRVGSLYENGRSSSLLKFKVTLLYPSLPSLHSLSEYVLSLFGRRLNAMQRERLWR